MAQALACCYRALLYRLAGGYASEFQQIKSLNYIRGRSFQQSLMLIDECQNLNPHQMKTIIARVGSGSKVICLGNLAQIDTPYLSATSSGLTYLTERFKDFAHAVHVSLQGVPRSILA